jgi:hypothetical protein
MSLLFSVIIYNKTGRYILYDRVTLIFHQHCVVSDVPRGKVCSNQRLLVSDTF